MNIIESIENIIGNIFGILLVKRGAIIKRNAKIAASTTLLANIEIGENAVVGAGAVVTRSIPAGKLAYGVPAKVVKDIENCEIQ